MFGNSKLPYLNPNRPNPTSYEVGSRATCPTIDVGALIVTNTILGAPYSSYSIMGPKPYSTYSGPYISFMASGLLEGNYKQRGLGFRAYGVYRFTSTIPAVYTPVDCCPLNGYLGFHLQ